MRTSPDTVGRFQKVGECLYRYSSNGVYYARFKSGGKEIRQSLETTDRDTAKRELARRRKEQEQIDRSQGKLTLRELCDRYLKTVQHQKPKTIAGNALVIRRMKDDWPGGGQAQFRKSSRPMLSCGYLSIPSDRPRAICISLARDKSLKWRYATTSFRGRRQRIFVRRNARHRFAKHRASKNSRQSLQIYARKLSTQTPGKARTSLSFLGWPDSGRPEAAGLTPRRY